MKVYTRSLASLVGLVILAGVSQAQVPAQKPAAVVNGEAIPMAELQSFLKSSQPPSPTALTEAMKKEMQATAINLLVDDVLMRQYLRKNAPVPTPQEIEKEFNELKAVLAKEKTNLEDFLKNSGQNEQQLRSDIAARIAWKNFISPRLTDQAIKKYYDDNKVFFDKVMVRASHILIKVAPNATQQDKQMIYTRLSGIRQDILTGKITFADAAKKYSDCDSKKSDGDLGLFPYKFVVAEPFARTAFSMKKNELSDVVATDFGYHLILVTDRTPGEPSNFEKIKADVKDICAQDYYQLIISEQRKVARIDLAP